MYLRNPNYMQTEENWLQKSLHYSVLKFDVLNISNHATVIKIGMNL